MMNLKLGKLPAQKDNRTIRMASIFSSVLPPIPSAFDVDSAYPGCDTPMFLNDQLGDCVIAGRAHMTRRFELVETKSVLAITDEEVRSEYFAQTGGADEGLNMLESLKAWRTGWQLSGQVYAIDAFASVLPAHMDDVRASIYLLTGCYCGVSLPLDAQKQIGKVWTVTNGRGSIKGGWGGHCIYLCGFNAQGPVCITWGAKQSMTWSWFSKYCDEAYGVVDSIDSWNSKPGIDVVKLNGYLKEITK